MVVWISKYNTHLCEHSKGSLPDLCLTGLQISTNQRATRECIWGSIDSRAFREGKFMYSVKEIKNAPSALLSYISTPEFLRTREKCGEARAECIVEL